MYHCRFNRIIRGETGYTHSVSPSRPPNNTLNTQSRAQQTHSRSRSLRAHPHSVDPPSVMPRAACKAASGEAYFTATKNNAPAESTQENAESCAVVEHVLFVIYFSTIQDVNYNAQSSRRLLRRQGGVLGGRELPEPRRELLGRFVEPAGHGPTPERRMAGDVGQAPAWAPGSAAASSSAARAVRAPFLGPEGRPEQAGEPRERWVVALMWAAAAQWCARALC